MEKRLELMEAEIDLLRKRIKFLEQGKVAIHEEAKRVMEEVRESGFIGTFTQERYDAVMNYKFPEWIEKDREQEAVTA